MSGGTLKPMEPSFFSAQNLKPPGDTPDNGTKRQEARKPSSSDMLTEGQQCPPVKERIDLLAAGLVKISYEEGNRLLPSITLDDKYFQELCSPWKECLVIKLLGKNVEYNMMKERLKKLWKLTGEFYMIDIDNDSYVVKCDLLADKEKIVSDGPWILFDHYLAVSHWTPEFVSPSAQIQRTIVWIRFLELNLVYYDESFLLAIAATVGKPIKVDANTLKVERGRSARICVEVELTKPAVGKVCINGHWYKVQYEGLHIICASCGCYGHTGNCPKPLASCGLIMPW